MELNVNQKIREVIFTLLKTEVDDDVELNSVGLDSMMFVSMIVCLEEQFDIEIPDEFFSIDKMKTIREIGEVIRKILDEKEK